MPPIIRSAAAALGEVLFAVGCVSSPARAEGAATPGDDPHETVAAYRSVLARGASAENPGLFTPASGSQMKRHPPTVKSQHERLAAIDAAEPLQLRVSGDRGVWLPSPKSQPTPPILMQRIDGAWRIDLVELAKNHQLDASGHPVFSNTFDPYVFAYPDGQSSWKDDLRPLDLRGEEIGAVLARLDASSVPQVRIRLGDLLLRNLGLTEEALAHYEEAARLVPNDWEVVSAFAERADLLGKPDPAIPMLERFEPKAYSLLNKLHARAGHEEARDHYARAFLAEKMKEWAAAAKAREAEQKRREGPPASLGL